MKKVWLLMLSAALLILGAGCGLFSDEGKDAAEEEKGPQIPKIEFGNYPRDDGNFQAVNPRKHFGIDEGFAMVFSLPEGEQFDTARLKIQIKNKKEDRVLQEIIKEVKPDSRQYKWEFTSSSDFYGFYETGDYEVKVLRGEDVLAEGEFTITN
ncbi:hypothetical protein [Desmospora activa]|uniref:Intracellular proteinase inhibitor BsuPI n=1 Tax=Desmospora activa DSM 45169 TaxID=1121389 RepID=A0A2T4Z1Z4_9BACL|nr:hypothetical protein [Desmospora activa]PTM54761.1 hypothetical protein C8J48_3413 [Desmospora activa DSM 45169]